MRKLVIVYFLFSMLFSRGQGSFFQGIGIFGSGTESAHFYKNTAENKRNYLTDDPAANPTTYNPAYYYPQSHISREYFSWGAGLFLEFLNRDRIRWQTEFAYMKKGAFEKEMLVPYYGIRSGSFSANKYTHIQWNNYLKFYNPIGFGSHWYLMTGVRLEYLLNSSASAFSSVAGSFPRFWFSGDVALGYEFPLTKKLFMFFEYHWNPDIIRHKHAEVKVRNRTFELRVGIMFRPRKKKIDDCNAPRYKGPAY